MLHISPSALRPGTEIRNSGDSGNLEMKGKKKHNQQTCQEQERRHKKLRSQSEVSYISLTDFILCIMVKRGKNKRSKLLSKNTGMFCEKQ